jgi:hypothetical protein
MQQANGEKNPAYSITTTTDVVNDIVTHIQVNARHNDALVLWPAVEGSRENTGEKHREVEADAGFASMENYERLEAEGQQALIPDSRMEVEEQGATARGEYDRSKFHYRERSDSYRCPAGQKPFPRCSPQPELSDAGFTKPSTCWTRCPRACMDGLKAYRLFIDSFHEKYPKAVRVSAGQRRGFVQFLRDACDTPAAHQEYQRDPRHLHGRK